MSTKTHLEHISETIKRSGITLTGYDLTPALAARMAAEAVGTMVMAHESGVTSNESYLARFNDDGSFQITVSMDIDISKPEGKSIWDAHVAAAERRGEQVIGAGDTLEDDGTN